MKTTLIAATALIVTGLATSAYAHSTGSGRAGPINRPAVEHRRDVQPPDTIRVRHSGRRRHVGRHSCLPRWRIRARLHRRGYTRLRLLDRHRNVVVLKARRYGGRRFILRVDRCDGTIIAARRAPRRWGHGHERRHDHGWRRYRQHTHAADF